MGNTKSKKSNDNTFTRTLDLAEIDSYQVLHHVLRTIWDGNFMSPIMHLLKSDNGANVLDVSCGPGTWTCEMSSDFRNSTFTGIDVVPMFPDQKPSNVKFILQQDLTSGLPFYDNSFDFIHLRLCWYYFTFDQWRTTVIKEFVRLLKPGGPATLNFCEDIKARAKDKQLDPEITYHLPTILSSTPTLSSEVHYELRTIPCGSWGGKVGEHHEQAIKDLVTKCYNEYLSPKAANKVVEQILNEFKEFRT
ncbi:34748_t:CDS:2, partial [Racocetra persica]